MMQHDIRGLELTASSADTVAGFDQALTEFLNYELVASRTLKGVVENDAECPMALVLRGYLLSMLETRAIRPKLDASREAAAALAVDGTERERQHVAALGAVATGDSVAACAIWETILASHPHDLLALKMHHYTSFWMGQSEALLRGVSSVAATWTTDTPGYGYVLGMHAFGLEESGELAQAETLGRQASEINGEDLWARHAVAHVLESSGRPVDGCRWLDLDAKALEGKNPFAGHLWWHRALFELELGNVDTVIALYDDAITATSTDFYLDVQNMASLLKRLELAGVDVGARWKPLADHAVTAIGDHALAFTDVHNFLSLAATGRVTEVDMMLNSLEIWAGTPNNYAASTMLSATVPLCRAIADHCAGRHERAVDGLLSIRNTLAPVGGSHAQRDLFTQILIRSAIDDGNFDTADSLLTERLRNRSENHFDWELYAGVLDSKGDSERAEAARNRRLV